MSSTLLLLALDLATFANVLLLACIVAASTLVSEYLISALPNVTSDDARHHISLIARNTAVPNFWIWYEGEAIYDVLEMNRQHIYELLIVSIFNAAAHTCAVAGFLFCLTLWLMRSLVGRAARRWYVWCVLLVLSSFACDLLEDLGMIVLIIGFPSARYPTLASATAWLSTLKYIWWFLIAATDLCAAAGLTLHGRVRKEKD